MICTSQQPTTLRNLAGRRSLLAALLLLAATTQAAEAASCTRTMTIARLAEVGGVTDSQRQNADAGYALMSLRVPTLGDLFVTPASCGMANVADWLADTTWQQFSVNNDDERMLAHLGTCYSFALVAQSDPDRYSLRVTVSLNDDDIGKYEPFGGYRYYLGQTGYLACSLVAK